MRVCIVQARLGSTRLPKKVLLPLNGHTVVEEVLARCKRIRGIDKVICAVPDTEQNDELASVIGDCYRGPEHDVLSRYLGCAIAHDASVIMRITADCPLIPPDLCSHMLREFSHDVDYLSNLEPRSFPQGYDCEVFRMEALQLADAHATGSDREHVTPWMRENIEHRANVTNVCPMEGRLTLDTEDDYKVICAAFGHKPYERTRTTKPPLETGRLDASPTNRGMEGQIRERIH